MLDILALSRGKNMSYLIHLIYLLLTAFLRPVATFHGKTKVKSMLLLDIVIRW